ncbi:TetR/AcrR family transcriptional regulator [Mycolicibacterium mucogenicum]|uniref:TetR/AcrR family transcriptional regulator n=1 Tax=Mycolicibacterium mucogenicum TaxID=56689 RepID=UPI002269AE30|nr:TetR/AcrR family transcriptional regulator [Mycolicibacterium mucogenicum]MCX8557407.1 TetR/AcrR family transcriptional regulator [Mycolicibacterium mucogenicum]
MGRPPQHTADDFLDAAARLFVTGGARALTMNAVARAVGAPSGSIYHRFPDRAALLAALWLRTTTAFQRGYLEALGEQPTADSAVGAAVWLVDWCRGHLPEAVVLQAGARAFEPDAWSEASRTELSAAEGDSRRRLEAAVRSLAKQTGRPDDQIAFALLDLPLAAVRRHLLAGEAPPKRVTTLVKNMVGLVLGVPAD